MDTFKKRQKEILRLEKQREKTARRLAKKKQRLEPEPEQLVDENGELLPVASDVLPEGVTDGAPEGAPAEPQPQSPTNLPL